MRTSNFRAVPYRHFGNLELVSEFVINTMHSELRQELNIVESEAREFAAVRNGFLDVDAEINRRTRSAFGVLSL